jgi:predicted small metal-binding protein
MKVLDCDICGETLQAANDAELTRRVIAHYQAEHEPIDPEEAEELVEQDSYEALDA